MKLKLLLALAIFVALGVFAFLDAKTTTVDDSKQLSADKVLGIVRTIGSAEATYKMNKGRFGTLQDLVEVKYLAFSDGFTLKDSTSATLKNYKLAIVPSTDGQHFQISMVSQSACDGGLFSNEAYVIFKGLPIGGCSEQKN